MPHAGRWPVDAGSLHRPVLAWYAGHARDLPWRDPSCSPWGVLVSEVMSQQTPVGRIEPVWREWMERWPTPAALAAESPGEVVRAWGRLGYPRRALRLREAAVAVVEHHGGQVPSDEAGLLSLPGVGSYTAAAVVAFAFGRRTTVVDTNVRRVLARAVGGREHAAPSLTAAESALAAAVVPEDAPTSATWNVAVMELGALVCQARAPRCDACPLLDRCAWVLAGRPPHDGPPRRGQGWHGTDRQVRGAVLQLLRDSPGPLTREALDAAGPDAGQVERCIGSLVEDGLLEPLEHDRFRLPA
ncbi:A/G-specific adenine glycosylase [Fodinibacter luteus]|uniref:A/G-specific adenine glycosylase n=1 Tax=Fodinibacter luteus TaxID=552064 RepID=UPI0031E8F322